MLIKVIKFTIKFKIFDFHYPNIPFCNFQNSVSDKMWCCLTFVCVYIWMCKGIVWLMISRVFDSVHYRWLVILAWFRLHALPRTEKNGKQVKKPKRKKCLQRNSNSQPFAPHLHASTWDLSATNLIDEMLCFKVLHNLATWVKLI